MADEQLRIGAEVDLSTINVSMEQAAETTHESTQQMINDFTLLGASAETAGDEVAAGAEKMNFSMREAKGSAALLGEEIGVHMNRHVAGFLAQLPGVGEAMSAAFSAFAIIALIEIIDKAAEKLSQWIADTFIFTEAQKALNAELAKTNEQIVKNNAEIDALSEKMKTLGTTPLQKLDIQIGEQTDKIKKQQGVINELRDKIFFIKQGWDTSGESIDSVNNKLGEAQNQMKLLQKQQEDLNLERGQAGLEAANKEAEARIAAKRSENDALIKLQEEQAKSMLEHEQITLEAEVALEKIGAANRLAANREYVTSKLAILEQDPDKNAAEITTLQAQLKTMETNFRTELLRIDDEYYKKKQEAQKKAAEESQREAKREQEAKLKLQEETVKGEEEGLTGQMEASRLYYEGRIKQIEELGAKHRISNASMIHQEEDMYREMYSAAVQFLEQKRTLAIQEIQIEAAKNGQIISQAQAQQLPAIQRIDAQILAEKQKLSNQIALLTTKDTSFFMTAWNTVQSSFQRTTDQMISGWIQGTETIGQAAQKMLGGMLTNLASFVANWLLKKAEMWIADKILSQTARATEGPAQVTSAAAIGTANAIASFALAPWPIDMGAPAFGASIGSTIEALAPLAAYETGGIVPNTGIALVHQGETVIPADMSRMLLSAATQKAGGQSRSGRGITINYNPSITAIDSRSFHDTLGQHADMISGLIQENLRAMNV